MTTRDDGGPAFPERRWKNMGVTAEDWQAMNLPGMTLREYFAAHAPPMPDSLWGGEPELHDDAARAGYLAVVAMWNYEYADAMLAHREEKSE